MTEIFTEEGITVVAARADSVERVEGGGAVKTTIQGTGSLM